MAAGLKATKVQSMSCQSLNWWASLFGLRVLLRLMPQHQGGLSAQELAWHCPHPDWPRLSFHLSSTIDPKIMIKNKTQIDQNLWQLLEVQYISLLLLVR